VTPNSVLALSLGIGIVTGLRSLTAPAAVSWAAHLGWLDLGDTPLALVGSTPALVVLSLLAVAEYVADLLPQTPARITPGPLIFRVLMGGLCGTCLCVSANQSWLAGAALGGIGGVIGAFVGYQARVGLVKALKVKDALIAIPEDLIAIVFAYLIVSQG
jgi:uncharacterized membrane protein